MIQPVKFPLFGIPFGGFDRAVFSLPPKEGALFSPSLLKNYRVCKNPAVLKCANDDYQKILI
jgi:hypothetical protein